MTHPQSHKHDAAQRKRRLLAEGAAYRANLAGSMQDVRENLRTGSLAKQAFGFAARTAFSMVKARGGGLQDALPFAIEAMSLIAKKPFLKKILRTVTIVAAVAGVANKLLRKKDAVKEEPEEDRDGERLPEESPGTSS